MAVGRVVQFFDYLLTTVVIVLTVVSWALVWHFRKTPIVAEAQPVLLSLLCGGVLLLIVGQIFQNVISFPEKYHDQRLATKGTVFCNLSDWFEIFGTLTVMTILFCKLYCVAAVTTIQRRHSIRVKHVMGIGLSVLAVAMGASAALYRLVPPDFSFLEFQDETTGLGFCRPIGSTSYNSYMLGRAIINLPLQIGILIFSWNLRNKNEQACDSRRIFHLSAFHLGLAATTWVVYGAAFHSNLLGFDETSQWFVHAFVQPIAWFMYTTSIVLALLVPRLLDVWYERVHERLPETFQEVAENHIGMRPGVGSKTTKPSSTRTARTAPPSARSLVTTETTPPKSDKFLEAKPSNDQAEKKHKAKAHRPETNLMRNKPRRGIKSSQAKLNTKAKTQHKPGRAINSPRTKPNSKTKSLNESSKSAKSSKSLGMETNSR